MKTKAESNINAVAITTVWLLFMLRLCEYHKSIGQMQYNLRSENSFQLSYQSCDNYWFISGSKAKNSLKIHAPGFNYFTKEAYEFLNAKQLKQTFGFFKNFQSFKVPKWTFTKILTQQQLNLNQYQTVEQLPPLIFLLNTAKFIQRKISQSTNDFKKPDVSSILKQGKLLLYFYFFMLINQHYIYQNLNRVLQMEKQLFEILNFIAHQEFQLENIRQLLCEQVAFNLTDAFNYLLGDTEHSRITINNLEKLLGKEHNQIALQNVLKFYSNNDLNLDFQQFKLMIVSREDQLLAKLVRERQETETQFPQFIVSYLKKLWFIELEIHIYLVNARKRNSNRELGTLLKFNKDQQIDRQLLKKELDKQASLNQTKKQNFCPHISLELALRYLKKNKVKCQLSFDDLLYLFIPQNSNLVKSFLKKKDSAFNDQISKQKHRVSNPLVHKQYKKLKRHKQKSTEQIPYSYRQRLSVQNHINRNKKLPSSKTIKTRISEFSEMTSQKMLIFFKSLGKIIKIAAQIESVKLQQGEIANQSLLELFQEITQNDELIPSQLKNYLEKAAILIQPSQCYPLFRRYANPLTGKITRKQFLNIFTQSYTLTTKTLKKGTNLSLFDRKQFLTILLKQISLEYKIEKQKLLFEENDINLRDVFSLIDAEQKRKISPTDLEVCCRQVNAQKLNSSELLTLWRRMGKKQLDEYIDYDLFMLEMLPKTYNKYAKSKHS